MNYLRIALNNSQFPFKYEERQVPALVPGMDTANRAPAAFTGSAGNMDWNIPQVIHVENYLPTARGYVGCCYSTQRSTFETSSPFAYLNKTVIFENDLGGYSDVVGASLVPVADGRETTSCLRLTSAAAAAFQPEAAQEAVYLDVGTVVYIRATVASSSAALWIGVARASAIGGPYTVVDTLATLASYTAPSSGYYLFYFYHATAGVSLISTFRVSRSSGIVTPVTDVTISKAAASAQYSTVIVRGTRLHTTLGTVGWDPLSSDLGYVPSRSSTATCNGVSYAFYPNIDFTAYSLRTSITSAGTFTMPAGYTAVTFKNIASSNNYLIGCNRDQVFWSTPANALDFSGYGSGYSRPSGLEGAIVAVISVANGFIIFSNVNAVSAAYTNIPNAPFRFAVIPGAGGITTLDQVAGDDRATFVAAWTSKGFQLISLNAAAQTLAEITDYLSSERLAQYTPEGTIGFIGDSFGASVSDPKGLRVMVNYAASRYIVISYKNRYAPWFQHALVLDTAINRWGHLRIDHTYALTYDKVANGLSSNIASDPRTQLAFLTPEAAIVSVDRAAVDLPSGYGTFGPSQPPYYGAGVTLGPVSLVRGSKLTFQELQASGITYPAEASLVVVPSQQGLETTGTPTTFSASRIVGTTKTFYGRVTGDAVEATFRGLANLQNLIVGVTKHGD